MDIVPKIGYMTLLDKYNIFAFLYLCIGGVIHMIVANNSSLIIFRDMIIL